MSTEELFVGSIAYKGPIAGENQRLKNGGARWTNTEQYNAFKEGLTLAANVQWKDETISRERVGVEIVVRVPKSFDPQNIIKPILDALQDSTVYSNDRLVKLLKLEESYRNTPQGVVILYIDVYKLGPTEEEASFERMLDRLDSMGDVVVTSPPEWA